MNRCFQETSWNLTKKKWSQTHGWQWAVPARHQCCASQTSSCAGVGTQRRKATFILLYARPGEDLRGSKIYIYIYSTFQKNQKSHANHASSSPPLEIVSMCLDDRELLPSKRSGHLKSRIILDNLGENK